MRKLGVVENITYSGLFLVRAEFAPRVGEGVIDARKRRLGRITRVFGPTKAPFVTVKPSEKRTTLEMVGRELYLE